MFHALCFDLSIDSKESGSEIFTFHAYNRNIFFSFNSRVMMEIIRLNYICRKSVSKYIQLKFVFLFLFLQHLINIICQYI